jgi:hypothetical protein
MKYLSLLLIALLSISCISTKSTIQNIDETAVRPKIKDQMFLIVDYAKDANYAFNEDYPINIGLVSENFETGQVGYFFNGIEGKNGEKILFEKIDTCCPFPSKNSTMGAGTISVYEYTIEGTSKKGKMYFNIFEKGEILCPKGFTIKKRTESTQ